METRDKLMMVSTGEWPCWPYLPLKKRSNFSFLDKNHFAVLVDNGESEDPELADRFVVVIGCNVFEPDSIRNGTEKTYTSLDEVVREWMVD